MLMIVLQEVIIDSSIIYRENHGLMERARVKNSTGCKKEGF
ncbi:MAG: hypothetical protein ACLVIY_07555 [Anaerobutyricum soehngenii]